MMGLNTSKCSESKFYFDVVLSVLVLPFWLLLLLLFCFLCVLIPSTGFLGNFFFNTVKISSYRMVKTLS